MTESESIGINTHCSKFIAKTGGPWLDTSRHLWKARAVRRHFPSSLEEFLKKIFGAINQSLKDLSATQQAILSA